METTSLLGHGFSSEGLPQFIRLYQQTLLWQIRGCEVILSTETIQVWQAQMWFKMPFLMMYFLVLPQFMRHQIQNLPAWMRLTMALFGFLFPREALFPRLRGEQRWRDFLPVLASALVSPPSHRGQRHPDFKRWHCKMEHGFGFCFLIEYEDEMKKTLVTAGRRPMTFFFFLFCFVFFVFPRRSHCLKRYFRNICKIAYFVQ